MTREISADTVRTLPEHPEIEPSGRTGATPTPARTPPQQPEVKTTAHLEKAQPRSARDEASNITTYRAPPGMPSAPVSDRQLILEHAFVAALGTVNLAKEGSLYVAVDQKNAAIASIALDRKRSPTERANGVAGVLVPLLADGRAPALVAIRTFLELSKSNGFALAPQTRQAIAHTLEDIRKGSERALEGYVQELDATVGLPRTPAGETDANAVIDLAELSHVLNRGSDRQRAEGMLRVLAIKTGPLAEASAAFRAVIFGGASKVLVFSPEEQQQLGNLMQRSKGSAANEKAEQSIRLGPLLLKVERVMGGIVAGAHPAYLAECREKGRHAALFVAHPAASNLAEVRTQLAEIEKLAKLAA